MNKSQEYEHWGKTATEFSKLTYGGGLLFAISYWLTTKDISFVKLVALISSSGFIVAFLLLFARRLFKKSIDEENKNG